MATSDRPGWAARLAGDAKRLGRFAFGAMPREQSEPPSTDPTGFYASSDPGPGPAGEVLAAEELPAPVPGTLAWRVRYRTFDAAGRPVAASMAVAAPDGPVDAPRPVVVWVHGAVGSAPFCGPSRAGFDAWYASELLQAGVVVVAPDLTGLGVEGVPHPYLHGTTAGTSVLDAARATAEHTETGAGTAVALVGHSAGGHAALWANELATAADDLDVRLTVAIAPVAALAPAMRHFATGIGNAAFPVQLAGTWEGVEPVVTGDVLTPAALLRLDDLRTERLDGLLKTFRGAAGRWVRDDAFTSGAWLEALERQSAGRRPGASRVLLVQGATDDAVPAEWTRDLHASMAGAGHDVAVSIYDGADHMGVRDAAAGDVIGALRAALGCVT